MGKRYQSLQEDHADFIRAQKLFFVGTAANDGTINVSPKGWDSLRLMDANRLVWRNVTGSGNETAAHRSQNNRMTLMFCAFDGRPKILRLYGKAQAFHARDAEFAALDTLFTPHPSTRQLVDFHIELVQTSCGFGVPLFKFQQERDDMDKWLGSKNDQDIKEYWGRKNAVSLDGLPTHILGPEHE